MKRVNFHKDVVTSVVEIPNKLDDEEAKAAMFYSKTDIKAFVLMAKQEIILRSMIRKMKRLRRTVQKQQAENKRKPVWIPDDGEEQPILPKRPRSSYEAAIVPPRRVRRRITSSSTVESQ